MDLRSFLQKYYPEMEPKRNQPGSMIRMQTTEKERKDAMARFYFANYFKYEAAASRFFEDNPDTLTEDNAIWVYEHYFEILGEEFLKFFSQFPTEE